MTGGGSAVTPLTLSSPTKATAFPIILWRCLAGSEHGITQPRPHDLRWVVRRAAGPKPSPQQANTVVIRRVGYGALGRLDRVRGVRFLRLTRRAADAPAQPEMTPRRHREVGGAAPLVCGHHCRSGPSITQPRSAPTPPTTATLRGRRRRNVFPRRRAAARYGQSAWLRAQSGQSRRG